MFFLKKIKKDFKIYDWILKKWIFNLAMMAAADVVARCRELKIYCLHIKLRARGGMESK